MPYRGSSTDEMGNFGIWAIVITVVVVLCVAFAAIAFGVLNVPLRALEREGIQQSPGYVQSKQTTLVDLKAEYQRLETEAAKYAGNDKVVSEIRAQQNQVLNQMRQEAALIPESEIPGDVRRFLAEHPE